MGKFNPGYDQEQQYTTKPPVPEEDLVTIYRAWRQTSDSVHIPRDFLQAARWWIAHQEPRRSTEGAEAAYNRQGEQTWRDPYLDRIVATWRIFLIDLTEIQKAFVIQGIESGNTPFRGDSFKFYKMVVEEQAKMDKIIADGQKDKYIDDVFIAMHKAVKGMQMPNSEKES